MHQNSFQLSAFQSTNCNICSMMGNPLEEGVCGNWGKAAGWHDSQAEGQQLWGRKRTLDKTSNTDWEKADEEKTISPPRHIDAVESSMQRRWGIKVTKQPRTKCTELAHIQSAHIYYITMRYSPAEPNPSIHARPQWACLNLQRVRLF